MLATSVPMSLIRLIAINLALRTVSAVPTSTTSGWKYCGKDFGDTFDSPTQQLAQASPVADTAGGALTYNGTAYSNQSPKAALGLLAPPSAPDVIAYVGTANLVRENGLQPGWNLIPQDASNPDPHDSFEYFDQRRICVACSIMDAGLPLGPPMGCTVQFTGLKQGGVQVPVPVEAMFNPVVTPGHPAEFACVDFPQKDDAVSRDGSGSKHGTSGGPSNDADGTAWTNLIAVNVQLLQSGAGSDLTAVLLDNNTYTAYSRC